MLASIQLVLLICSWWSFTKVFLFLAQELVVARFITKISNTPEFRSVRVTIFTMNSFKSPKYLCILFPSGPPQYPNDIGFISLSFVTPKIYGFHFPQPKNMWVSLCSKLNTQNVPPPLLLYTQTLYWFRFPWLWQSQNLWVSFRNFPQPHSPTICEFPFPQP